MALVHPRSLERWQEWQSSRSRARGAARGVGGALRSLRRSGDPDQEPQYVLHSRPGEGSARILIALDEDSRQARTALLTCLDYLHAGVDVLAPAGLEVPELADPAWQRRQTTAPTTLLEATTTSSVITQGWHLPAGALLHEWAHEADVPAAVVQHELLTPYAPPLPPNSTLLAWTEADGQLRRSDREDIEVRVVGSQLLWQAAHEGPASAPGPAADGDPAAGVTDGDGDLASHRPVFLDQPEIPGLSRRLTLRATMSFCRAEQAVLRPHPGRRDALTRGAHALLRRRGIELEDPVAEMLDPRRPVVGILDARLLESAARGVPTWVYGRGMPTWVHECWQRYGLRHWGGPPSPVPVPSADEPSRLIAQILDGAE